MERQSAVFSKYIAILSGVLILSGLYLTSLYSYLLFHTLVELFSIVVACGIFMFAWNSRDRLDNNYLLLIGIAYLFVAGLDLTHTLAYAGMGVFRGYATNLPTQLWIAARYTESFSLLIAPLLFRRKLNVRLVLFGYIVASVVLLCSIFYWEVFPVCFVEGVGLTPFKKVSEYIISVILLASIVLLFRRREEFDRDVWRFLVASIVVTIGSELALTFYVHAYGLSNLVGHFFKVFSFYLIYRAIIQTGLVRPYDLLFRNLKQSEEVLRKRATLDQVRVAVYEMRGLADIEKVLMSLYEGLRIVGLKFNGCSVQIVDEEKKRVESYYLDTDGVSPKEEWSLVAGAVYEAWRDGQPIYRQDMDKEDRYNERASIAVPFRAYIRCVVDVPFSHGTLAINSVEPEAFSEEEIETLGEFASVLSEAYTRFQDIRRIEASLVEKEVLLREIHHRVKNNLQVISSIFNLQRRYVEDQQVLDILRESQDRIRSMAFIHEKLYQSESLLRVDFGGYIRTLTTHLFRSYRVSEGDVRLGVDVDVDVDAVSLEIGRAIPCGLILNELVSNSLKHGFPCGRGGEVGVGFHSDGSGGYVLEVRDDGVGFPSGVDFREVSSLGLELVEMLVQQLKGSIEFHSDGDGGTEFRIAFQG